MFYFLKSLFGSRGIARRYSQIYDEIRKVKPKNIMEIGVLNGDKARKMIEIASKFNPSDSIHYYGFDLFEPMSNEKFSKEVSKQPLSMGLIESKLREMGVHVHLFKGDTVSSLPFLEDKLPDMDLIFIDGGHSLETIKNDWFYSSKLMHDNTVVIFDDYWSNRIDAGARITVDAIDRNKYDVTIMPTIDSFDTPYGHLDIQLAKVVKI